MQYTPEELANILNLHKLWLNNDPKGKRADLDGANLSDTNLSYAYLSYAYLSNANLSNANLYNATLSDANLSYATLNGANLRGADLSDANLRGADLSDANLRSANLFGANLFGANLSCAKGAELIIARTRVAGEGDIIGWKKCRNDLIVKLLIPKKAKRSNAFGRKCRAEFAKVLDIRTKSGRKAKSATSDFSNDFVYKIGATVRPTCTFSEDWQVECAPGIHFYITREEAVAHEL